MKHPWEPYCSRRNRIPLRRSSQSIKESLTEDIVFRRCHRLRQQTRGDTGRRMMMNGDSRCCHGMIGLYCRVLLDGEIGEWIGRSESPAGLMRCVCTRWKAPEERNDSGPSEWWKPSKDRDLCQKRESTSGWQHSNGTTIREMLTTNQNQVEYLIKWIPEFSPIKFRFPEDWRNQPADTWSLFNHGRLNYSSNFKNSSNNSSNDSDANHLVRWLV